MTAILIAAALFGPPVPPPSLTLHLHLGTDRQSKIIASELRNEHPWFKEHRRAVEDHFRIAVDDDARLYPTYQIGYGGERERFREGTFMASGTFILALESIARLDEWERSYPENTVWIYTIDGTSTYRRDDDKPEVFPPVQK